MIEEPIIRAMRRLASDCAWLSRDFAGSGIAVQIANGVDLLLFVDDDGLARWGLKGHAEELPARPAELAAALAETFAELTLALHAAAELVAGQ
jgi:hypothetical protein